MRWKQKSRENNGIHSLKLSLFFKCENMAIGNLRYRKIYSDQPKECLFLDGVWRAGRWFRPLSSLLACFTLNSLENSSANCAYYLCKQSCFSQWLLIVYTLLPNPISYLDFILKLVPSIRTFFTFSTILILNRTFLFSFVSVRYWKNYQRAPISWDKITILKKLISSIVRRIVLNFVFYFVCFQCILLFWQFHCQ